MLSIPMSDEQFAAAATRLQAQGVMLSGPSGKLTRDGITARYEHADGMLQVEIVDKPFLLPLSLIESKLRGLIESNL